MLKKRRLLFLSLSFVLLMSLLTVFPAFSGSTSTPGFYSGAITINYVQETLSVTASVPFLQFALAASPQDTTDQKLLDRERWNTVMVIGGKADIDISRVIPRNDSRPYYIALRDPDNHNTRTVIQIPARQQNRVAAGETTPEINVGRANRNNVGIGFTFDVNNTYIRNHSGVEVNLTFGSNPTPIRLVNTPSTPTSIVIGGGIPVSTDGTTITIPTRLLDRALAFSVSIPAVDGASGKFASVPVRMTVPAQPKAPNVTNRAPNSDTTGGTVNIRLGQQISRDGTAWRDVVAAGSTEASTNIALMGSATPLSSILRQFGITAEVAADSPPELRTLYFRTAHVETKSGTSAVRALVISAANWNNAVKTNVASP